MVAQRHAELARGGREAPRFYHRNKGRQAEAAIEAASAHAGLTQVLCYQIVQSEKTGDLIKVLCDYEPEPVPLSLVYPSSHLIPLKLRAFIGYAVPRLKLRLQSSG